MSVTLKIEQIAKVMKVSVENFETNRYKSNLIPRLSAITDELMNQLSNVFGENADTIEQNVDKKTMRNRLRCILKKNGPNSVVIYEYPESRVTRSQGYYMAFVLYTSSLYVFYLF